MNTKIMTVAAMLAAYACTVGAAAPQTDTVKLVHFQEKATAQAAMMTKAYKNQAQTNSQSVSIILPQSIALALQNNRTLHQSQWDYEAAVAQVGGVTSGRNPSVYYTYKADHTGSNGTSKTSNAFLHQLRLEVSLFNRVLDAQIEAAKYSRDGSGAALTEAAQTAKLTAATNYLSLIMSRNKVNVAEQTVRDYEEHLKNANLQYQVGIVSKSDVLATNTRLANAKTALVEAKNAANLAEAKFNNHVGLPVSTPIVTADKELSYAPYGISLESAKSYGVAHRGAIVQAAMAVKAAEENVGLADASDIPVVKANASRRMNGAHWAGNDSKDWSVGATLSWNVWDGGQSKANVSAAKAKLEKAKEAYAQTIDTVELQVQEAYLNLKAAEQKIKSTHAAVEAGQEDFRIKTLRYRSGVGTNVDVLDAETALATARNNYVDALYNYNLSMATLEKAMGISVEATVGSGAMIVNQG